MGHSGLLLPAYVCSYVAIKSSVKHPLLVLASPSELWVGEHQVPFSIRNVNHNYGAPRHIWLKATPPRNTSTIQQHIALPRSLYYCILQSLSEELAFGRPGTQSAYSIVLLGLCCPGASSQSLIIYPSVWHPHSASPFGIQLNSRIIIPE